MKRTRQVLLIGSTLSLLTVLSLGCGGGSSSTPGKVTGNVTLDGAPVTGGDLYIHTKGGAVHAVINPNGSYTATDIPVGEWKVTVNTEALNPNKKEDKGGGGKAEASNRKVNVSPRPASAKGAANPGTYVAIPKQYQDDKATPLSVTVTTGTVTKNFELTK